MKHKDLSRTTTHARFRPAGRLHGIGVSEILSITNRAAFLKKQGRDIISLSIGEPDFDTPDWIKDAAERAIRDGDTKYTALDGSPAMKAAVREKFYRENRLDFSMSQITVSAGAKQVLYNALMATIDPGDEVILAAPYWVSYADIVAIAGGRVVVVEGCEENGFRLMAEDLEDAITDRTRWILFNSPSNPSGAAYSAKNYGPLLDVIRRYPEVWLMVDDMYEHIIFDGLEFSTPAALASDLADRILTVNGVSKAYAMTGWRIGYAGGPEDLIKAMAIVQSQSTSCPSSISQRAAIAAITGPQDIVRERCFEFETRRNVVVGRLNEITGLRCLSPDGSFYAFPNCASFLGWKTPSGERIASDGDFSRYLLDQASVAVVPGSAFGLNSYFRVSYATSLELIKEACRRIENACAELREMAS